ncbi:hypothetical protein [Alkalihalobacillus pseudalcaliphilus]|uniref:hypothetical protein n=1 Tax=Alkalihalobacillus pseudalcaliphilus TaxID=79884 RepID=UPI000A4D5912|nr:hypothetical protein [Alkalihalobacillus pseudalcaliphilus]
MLGHEEVFLLVRDKLMLERMVQQTADEGLISSLMDEIALIEQALNSDQIDKNLI